MEEHHFNMFTIISEKIIKRKQEINIKNPEILLQNNENQGLGLRVKITSASEIEPWLLAIDYISLDKFSIKQVYNNSEQDLSLNDKNCACKKTKIYYKND